MSGPQPGRRGRGASAGRAIVAWDLGCINQNFAETLAIADNVPGCPDAWVLIGVNLGRFTADPARASSSRWSAASSLLQERVPAAVRGDAPTASYRYSHTILPGIFAYLTSYLKQDGPALLSGRAERRASTASTTTP